VIKDDELVVMHEFDIAVTAKNYGDLDTYYVQIRKVYRLLQPEIDASVYHPNVCDWPRIMSPIEREAWIDIQQRRLRMFPQYPALHYFLDFAEPWQKVAIECDGKIWHTDQARDAERDALLRADGWRVYRIPGKWIWRERPEDEDERVARGHRPFTHWLDMYPVDT
jgi:very-short-patch-repair endonuclease